MAPGIIDPHPATGRTLGYTAPEFKQGISMPPLPDQHALAVLGLTVVALFLFTRERIPLETSSLLVLALLAAGFEWFP